MNTFLVKGMTITQAKTQDNEALKLMSGPTSGAPPRPEQPRPAPGAISRAQPKDQGCATPSMTSGPPDLETLYKPKVPRTCKSQNKETCTS